MADDLSAAVTSCLKTFNTFVQLPQIDRFDNEVSSVLWRDELGRLRIWAGNIGAHQTGQSSLGYRLRDASHISNQILRLVRDLESTIKELEMLLLQKDDGSSRRDQDVDRAGSAIDAVEAELISRLMEEAESDSLTEVQRIYDDTVDIINGLYKVSMLIRKPAARDRFLHRHEEDAMGFEPFDINHVANKFPRLSEVVVRRIGSAITWRRRNLKYWERHHAKLEQGLDGIEDPQEALSQTVATEFKSSAVPVDEQGSDTGRSQTSYAPSLLSGGAVSVPPRPKESLRGIPFQCPICYYIISIKDEDSWARHVFKDLVPYVCVYPNCSMPNKRYDSRHEWFDHEFRAHLRELTATENRVNDTSTERLKHGLLECPVCVSEPQRISELERHIAKHLEEVALFVLPSSFDNEGDEISVQDRDKAGEPDEAWDTYEILGTAMHTSRNVRPPREGEPLPLVIPTEGIRLDVLKYRLQNWFGPDVTVETARSSSTGVRLLILGIRHMVTGA
jgi:hypothetical protein